MKEAFIEAHMQLVEAYLEAHPGATWDQAYEATGDMAYDRMRDNLADRIDTLRLRAKEGR